MELDENDIADIMQRVLYEFPVCEIAFTLPRYIGALPPQHPVRQSIYQSVAPLRRAARKCAISDIFVTELVKTNYVGRIHVDQMALGSGKASISIEIPEQVFYEIVGQQTKIHIQDAADLISVLSDFCGDQTEI